jgi:hypothetical protein
MKKVDERPEGAKFRAVSWSNAGDVRRWLLALHEAVDDLRAAARDRVRKKRGRVLSRHEAGRKVRGSGRTLAWLLAAAEAGLGPQAPVDPLPEPPDEPEEGEAFPSSSRRPVDPPNGGEAG